MLTWRDLGLFALGCAVILLDPVRRAIATPVTALCGLLRHERAGSER